MARSPSGSPSAAQTAVGFLDRFQVPLYFAAAALGAALGLSFEAPAAIAGRLVEPALVALLFATFLGVPSTRLGRAARDWRFLSAVALVNFVLAPAVAWLVTRPIAGDEALVTGALIVLLSPCVDYVIVFSGLAGGDRERLLAVTPAVMLLQIVLVPAYLWLLAGGDVSPPRSSPSHSCGRSCSSSPRRSPRRPGCRRSRGATARRGRSTAASRRRWCRS